MQGTPKKSFAVLMRRKGSSVIALLPASKAVVMPEWVAANLQPARELYNIEKPAASRGQNRKMEKAWILGGVAEQLNWKQ